MTESKSVGEATTFSKNPLSAITNYDMKFGIQGRLFLSHFMVVVITSLAIYIATCIINPVVLKQTTIAGGFGGGLDILTICSKAAQTSLIWGLGAAVLLAGVISFLVSDKLVTPLRKMQSASKDIVKGNFKSKLDEQLPGELGSLARAYNSMAAQLEEVEAQRVTLINNLSHELSTPLSSLKGFVEGMEDGFFSANKQTLGACQRQIGRLERLVRDLSLVSKVEAGAYELHKTQFTASKLLESCKTDALYNAQEKNINLAIDCPKDLKLTGDSQRLEQVIGNLVHNAIKHCKANDTVTLSAKQTDSTTELSVTDTGEGIPQASIKHLFNRFYQVDKARKQVGSGIGLTIAKHFTEAHNGSISVNSNLGTGSSFTVSLPISPTLETSVKPIKSVATSIFTPRPSNFRPSSSRPANSTTLAAGTD